MEKKSAEELIAAGYRLHWVTVEKEIPVLCMPEEAYGINGFTAHEWAHDDAADWLVTSMEMKAASEDVRACLPHCDDIDGNPPTIGELLDAQAAADAEEE